VRIITSIRAVGCGVLLMGSLLVVGAGAAGAQEAPAAGAGVAAAVTTGAARPFILMFELTVKPDREQDFLKLLHQMKERVVHQDKGNIVYELFAVAPARPSGTGAAPTAQDNAPATAHQYIFLEEWRDRAAATAHGKWAGPIVRTSWKEMTESMRMVPLSRVALR
jgi:quinol monooxygenase YgiN